MAFQVRVKVIIVDDHIGIRSGTTNVMNAEWPRISCAVRQVPKTKHYISRKSASRMWWCSTSTWQVDADSVAERPGPLRNRRADNQLARALPREHGELVRMPA